MSHSFLSRLFAAVAFAAVTLAHAAEPPVPNLFEAIGNLLKPDEPTAEPAVPTAPDPATRAVAAPSAQRSRVALVIGNADYKSGPLANPVNDAQAMAARLRGLGFDVVLRENLKTREIGSVYREFRSKIAPGGAALVFYAGHGVQFKGENYFPAIDAEIHGEEDVPLQSLNLNTLLSNMEEAKAGVSLVFLDACRDNPFARRFRSGSRGLAKVEAASGTLIHYATRPGSVASDGDGRNGTYTEALLAQMNEPGVPVEMMLKRVANRVVEKTGGKQEPWVEGSLRGEFYFIFQGPATVNVQQAPADPEAETWQAAERANTEGAYRAYLDAYPAGRYATAAKIAIDTFKKPEPPPVPDDPEAALWVEVKQSGAKEYYEAYLKQYTKGKYAALAKVELKKIEAREKAERAKEEAERKAALAREEAEKKAAAERERQAQVQAEKEAWERAKGDNTVLAYAGYLESWPKGRFAALAEAGKQKAQREAAEREKQETARREQEAKEADQRAWEQAERSNTEEAYRRYRLDHPLGRYTMQVPEKLRKLEADAAYRAETEHWHRAEAAKDSATVQGYLDRYPAGRYVQDARTRFEIVLKAEKETKEREEAERRINSTRLANNQDALALAKRNNCFACHSVDKRIVGPAYRDVASKYRGRNVGEQLFNKVRFGGKGVWGSVPMVPNRNVSDTELQQLIDWILSL